MCYIRHQNKPDTIKCTNFSKIYIGELAMHAPGPSPLRTPAELCIYSTGIHTFDTKKDRTNMK